MTERDHHPPPTRRRPTVLDVPEDATDIALHRFVVRARTAIAHGDVELDTTAARGWPPGGRLLLERLEHLARRTGRSWHDTAS